MMNTSEWTTTDFETLSWHDCHFYGFGMIQEKTTPPSWSSTSTSSSSGFCGPDRKAAFRVAPRCMESHTPRLPTATGSRFSAPLEVFLFRCDPSVARSGASEPWFVRVQKPPIEQHMPDEPLPSDQPRTQGSRQVG
jgi:hypothetical protein